ncbi:MAG TPA: tRNA 2-thiocytidine biosynthesis TtcA family protein [Spirochaetia bacterium]|nr:tRNA 2-thiocytidine biosynthesis TtcA family protein [Spirochaetia bacterium]
MDEIETVPDILSGRIPPYVMRFARLVGKGVNRFSMIQEGEHILLGISGGKDSLALSFALSLRKKWLPIDYTLEAVHIDWGEYPLPEEKKEKLVEFFSILGIPYRFIQAQMFPPSFKGEFNCYLCARNRRRILFEEARRLGVKKIALGHHLDDFVETSLINLCFRGEFSTMQPVQDFFGGKIQIIRPLCLVKESTVNRISERLTFPVAKVDCPNKDTNIRNEIKPIVAALSHIDRHTRNHIFEAHFHT